MNEELASSKIKRAVFVDRDGVLNRPVICDGRPYPPQRLKHSRFYLVCPKRCISSVTQDFL